MNITGLMFLINDIRYPRGVCLCHGSIPASAGQPGSTIFASTPGKVYPRECGATEVLNTDEGRQWGLSPRVRGNRPRPRLRKARSGSIPASAGQPCIHLRHDILEWVYPRECGATHDRRRRSGHQVRSIPASAGQPRRVCGLCFRKTGLSPRVRGNRMRAVGIRAEHGSIPASAGQPTTGCASPTPARVYPRECGATVCEPWGYVPSTGLSPRVRGNRLPAAHRQLRRGSIPASAGQPVNRPTSPSWWRGLSPRVRGNPTPCG